MRTTEAWVLHAGDGKTDEAGELRLEAFSFPDPLPHEVLIAPLFGSWEANMSHAIARRPVDIARQRKEDRVVLGNAGVVRVLEVGSAVRNVRPGDVCAFFGTGVYDAHGYMELAHAYDAPGTVGVLAKETKVDARNMLPLPRDSKYSLEQWAAFSLRYMTAWSNWRVALGAFRLQLSEADVPRPTVWAWGGGTALAQLDLAHRAGCDATLVTATDAHAEEARRRGIAVVDRRAFPNLAFDPERYAADATFRSDYQDSERRFLAEVKQRTGGAGVSIFIDYVGTAVVRATLKALGRQGVLTTAGWKTGMDTPLVRAIECIKRHTHVYTHYARLEEAPHAIAFAEKDGWIPTPSAKFAWHDVPRLANEYSRGAVGYFPVFAVNGAPSS